MFHGIRYLISPKISISIWFYCLTLALTRVLIKGHNILIFLLATIFQLIDFQFPAGHKDYPVKYLFWKFPVHSDASCKLCISWLYNDCFSIGLHATYSPKYRSYDEDSMGSKWSMWIVGSLHLCQPGRRRCRRCNVLLRLNFVAS